MNKFRKFFGKISAETCLKMDYFGNKSAKRWGLCPQIPCFRLLGASASPPDLRLGEITKEYVRPCFRWNYLLMQMIGNFGAKRNTYFVFSAPSPLFKKRFRATT